MYIHFSTDKSEDPSKSSVSWIPLGIKLILKGGEVLVKEYEDKTEVKNPFMLKFQLNFMLKQYVNYYTYF